MPNADVNISVVIASRKQLHDEPFSPTDLRNADFQLVTDLEDYDSVTGTLATDIYTYVLSQRAEGYTNALQAEVRLDNVTHTPSIGKGVIPLPKGHRSAGLTGEEITSADVIEDFLNQVVINLRNTARY